MSGLSWDLFDPILRHFSCYPSHFSPQPWGGCMGYAFYFVWPGLGCGQAAAQEPVTNLRVGLPPPSLAGHESPFPPKALRAPRGVSKIRRPCPGLSLSPRALTLPQASSLLQVEAQGLLPPIPHPQRSCGVHGLANSPGGKAMTTQMSRCFLITLCLQRRLWGRCQIVRGGPEPRRQWGPENPGPCKSAYPDSIPRAGGYSVDNHGHWRWPQLKPCSAFCWLWDLKPVVYPL